MAYKEFLLLVVSSAVISTALAGAVIGTTAYGQLNECACEASYADCDDDTALNYAPEASGSSECEYETTYCSSLGLPGSTCGSQVASVVFSCDDGEVPFFIPAGVTQLWVGMWGGAGYGRDNTVTPGQGGAGGYVTGLLDVSGISKLSVTAGCGAITRTESGLPGGGASEQAPGGGHSIIRQGSSTGTILAVAGGGGGGAYGSDGGAGGGQCAQRGVSELLDRTSACGGSITEGGNGTLNGESGSFLQGGNAILAAGGGGSGYFGGGAGLNFIPNEDGAGGGGSSFTGALLSALSVPGTFTEPGGAADSRYAACYGCGMEAGPGSHGAVVLSFVGVGGCTNPTAANYHPDATVDDGTCMFNADLCSNAGVDCSSFTTKHTFSTPNSETNFVVPAGVTQLLVKVWGAGGEGRSVGRSSIGGAGGFVAGFLDVTPGETLTVAVGGGGGAGPSGLGGFPGGGDAGDPASGDGGGYSGIFRGSSIATGDPVAIAGAGGGGVYGSEGGAGGLYAQDGISVHTETIGIQGLGATPFTGGLSQPGSPMPRGSYLQGSDAKDFGGAGGGGLFGGGSGLDVSPGRDGSGGGGSSYFGGLSLAMHSSGNGATPGGTGDAEYSSPVGEGGNVAPGSRGEVIIRY